MRAFWQQCEGQIVDGFPLEQYLGGDDSAVFLTHRAPDSSGKAAIKLIHADAESSESQLGRWRRASEFTHPNLLRLYERGRGQLNGVPLLYVVMDFADENLAQVLPERALTSDEMREMIQPALRALAFLHASGFVHGRLKPSNFLAVGNVLKLSSDGAREIGAGATPADDVWALGVTLVEALTQKAPDVNSADLGVGFPPEFRDIVRNSLRRDPRDRWTVAQIQQRLSPARAGVRKQIYAIAAGVVMLLLAMVAGTRLIHQGSEAPVAQTQPPPPVAAPREKPSPVSPPPKVTTRSSGSDVIHEVMPDVLDRARNSIHGKVDVEVRIDVNESGNVQRATLASHGPSKYFADASLKAAQRWKFAPGRGSGTWMLRFEFTKAGTKVTRSRMR